MIAIDGVSKRCDAFQFPQKNNALVAVLAYVAKEPAAIGYIGFDYINKEIKPLSINGIEPSLENAKEKKYAIHRKLYLYVDEKKYTSELKSFIIYVMSSEGQKVVEKNGFIPLYPFSTEQ